MEEVPINELKGLVGRVFMGSYVEVNSDSVAIYTVVSVRFGRAEQRLYRQGGWHMLLPDRTCLLLHSYLGLYM